MGDAEDRAATKNMPIVTNPTFDAQNLKLAKRPLYVIEIDGVANPIATFRAQDLATAGGYGIGGYGINGYGS